VCRGAEGKETHKTCVVGMNVDKQIYIYTYIVVRFIVPYGTKETISGKMVMENWYVAMHSFNST